MVLSWFWIFAIAYNSLELLLKVYFLFIKKRYRKLGNIQNNMISGVPKISRFPIPNPRLISVRNLETLGQRNWMNTLKQLSGMENWGQAIFLGLQEGSIQELVQGRASLATIPPKAEVWEEGTSRSQGLSLKCWTWHTIPMMSQVASQLLVQMFTCIPVSICSL